MTSAADRAFGELDSDVTDDEIAAMTRLGKRLGKNIGHRVASRYNTKQTVMILEHFEEILGAWAETIDIADVRADKTRVEQGQKSELLSGLDAQTAHKAAEYDKVQKELDELKSTANGSGPKGLGAGSGTDAILERLRPFVDASPDAGDNLVSILTSLTDPGTDNATRRARSILASKIARSDDPEWVLAKDPGTGQMLPACLVDAYTKIKQHEQTIANGTQQLADLQVKLDPTVTDSVAWKAAEFDKNTDARNPNGYQAMLDAAYAERDAAKQQLANAKAPADMIAKPTVKAEVDKVSAELKKVKLGITGVQNVDETKLALRKLADLVKP